MFYSKSTKGFYTPEINGVDIPTDAVKITLDHHAALLKGNSLGQDIVPDANGYPVLTELTTPSKSQLALVKINKLEASVTQRRLREAVLGIDGGWLVAVNLQIEALRKSL